MKFGFDILMPNLEDGHSTPWVGLGNELIWIDRGEN